MIILPPLKSLSSVVLLHQNLYIIIYLFRKYFSPDSDKMISLLEKYILWIEDLYFSNRLKLKCLTKEQFSLTMLTDGLESCGLL